MDQPSISMSGVGTERPLVVGGLGDRKDMYSITMVYLGWLPCPYGGELPHVEVRNLPRNMCILHSSVAVLSPSIIGPTLTA